MSVHLYGDDRVRLWRPARRLLESSPYSVDCSCFGKASLQKVISCTSDELKLKTPKCIVLFTFFSDLTKQCSDSAAQIKTGLWKVLKNPNLDLLAKLTAEADAQWKKEMPGLKVIWTLPTFLDFLECNFKFVDVFNQDTLSEREIRGSLKSTTNYRQHIETLKNSFTTHYPEVDILDLNSLLVPSEKLKLRCHFPSLTLPDMIFSPPESFFGLQTNFINYLQECTWFEGLFGVIKAPLTLAANSTHEVPQPKATVHDKSVVPIKTSVIPVKASVVPIKALRKIEEPKDISNQPFDHVVVIGNSLWIQKTFQCDTPDHVTFFPVEDWSNLEDLCELTQKKPAKTLWIFLGDLHIVTEEITGKSRQLAIPRKSCSHCDRGHEFREFKIGAKSAGKSGAAGPEEIVKHHFEIFKSELAIFRQSLPRQAEVFCSPVIPYVIAGIALNLSDLNSYHRKLHNEIKYFPTLMFVNEKEKIWNRFVNAFTSTWQEIDQGACYSSKLDTILTKCLVENKMPIRSFFRTSPTLVESAYKKSKLWLVNMWNIVNKSIGNDVEVLLPEEDEEHELQDETLQDTVNKEAEETRPSHIAVEVMQLKEGTLPSPMIVEEVVVKESNITNVTHPSQMTVDKMPLKEGNSGEDVELTDNQMDKPKERMFVFSNPVRQLAELCEGVPMSIVQKAVSPGEVEMSPTEERQKHYFMLTVEGYSVTFGAASSSKARARAARKILKDLLNGLGPATDPNVANSPAIARLRADVEEKTLAKFEKGGQQELLEC